MLISMLRLIMSEIILIFMNIFQYIKFAQINAVS